MRALILVFALACALRTLPSHAASDEPAPPAPASSLPQPRDIPYPGKIQLSVDATDVSRRVVHVRERLSGVSGKSIVLYPKWLPGVHAPAGPIQGLSGLRVTADGNPIRWTRDTLEPYAFHVDAPPATGSLTLEFDYLSATSSDLGTIEFSHDIGMIDWNELVLYPAGYFARQIPVEATLTLPAGWQFAGALERASTASDRTTFRTTDLETLIDSPAYAGKYFARHELDRGTRVYLNLFGDSAAAVAIKPEQLQVFRNLVQQAYRLFGSHHFAHYDFLFSLSDQVTQRGLEHHQSSENGDAPESFEQWDESSRYRDLLAHEFTHTWNGKFRRPADLWTPSYDVPMQDSLLWVYEGGTQYWGYVLAARAGLWSKQQALDYLALVMAYQKEAQGRKWRALQDSTNDPIIYSDRKQAWEDWQRLVEYYDEGALIWLDVDTLIRERSKGARALDDFARRFFGIADGEMTPHTYTFGDVVAALNAVEPYDWEKFLRERLDAVGGHAPLDGVQRGGYRLVYSDTPTDSQRKSDEFWESVDLLYSIGLAVDDSEEPGTVSQVMWNSPAFAARILAGSRIVAVNGLAYSSSKLTSAVRMAKDDGAPVELIVKSGDRFDVVKIDYHGGLRYPRLERDESQPARLDDILSARQ